MKKSFILVLALCSILMSCYAGYAADMASTNAKVRGELLADLAETSDKIMQLAKAIPDTKYGWKPAEGVRSVAEVFTHIAGSNYFLLKFAGVKPPEGMGEEAALDKVTDKAKILDALQKSFDFAKKAITDMSDEDMDKVGPVFGHDMTHRMVAMIVTGHLHEHLGQAIAYARSNGVVPPWSAKGM